MACAALIDSGGDLSSASTGAPRPGLPSVRSSPLTYLVLVGLGILFLVLLMSFMRESGM